VTCFGVIGRLEKTVIDCPDPRVLAQFYCQMPGMTVNEDIDGWVVIGAEPGLRQLTFQQVDKCIPPRWPDPAHPQQLTSTFASAMPTKPSKSYSRSALRACALNVRRPFESSPTPSVTHSASCSASTAQPEPRYSHQRRRRGRVASIGLLPSAR
jgi:Glyoxalase-like domain